MAERALAEGKTPLEVMLDNMRHFQQVAIDAEATLAGLTVEEIGGGKMDPEEQFKFLLAKAKQAAGLRQAAHDCARDAAPYMHPRLAAIEHTGANGGPIETTETAPRDLARAVLAVLREARTEEPQS